VSQSNQGQRVISVAGVPVISVTEAEAQDNLIMIDAFGFDPKVVLTSLGLTSLALGFTLRGGLLLGVFPGAYRNIPILFLIFLVIFSCTLY
jgi:hypothetical protein